MNVSAEADAAFIRELESADPARFANLMRNMRKAAAKSRREDVCANPKCSNTLLTCRVGAKYCSDACRKQADRIAQKHVENVLDQKKAA